MSRIVNILPFICTISLSVSDGGVFPFNYLVGSILRGLQVFSSLRSLHWATPSQRLTLSRHSPLSQLNWPTLQLASKRNLSSSSPLLQELSGSVQSFFPSGEISSSVRMIATFWFISLLGLLIFHTESSFSKPRITPVGPKYFLLSKPERNGLEC